MVAAAHTINPSTNMLQVNQGESEKHTKAWNKTAVSIGSGVALMGAAVAVIACRYGLSKDAMLNGLSKDGTALQNFAKDSINSKSFADAYQFTATQLSYAKDGLGILVNKTSEGLESVGFYRGLASVQERVVSGLNAGAEEISSRFDDTLSVAKEAGASFLASTSEALSKVPGKIQDFISSRFFVKN